MTFEEAKDVFLNHGWIKVGGGTYFDGSKWREAIRVLSDYLKREPCEDCISRQAVIDGINEYFHDEYYQRTSIQDCRDCLIKDVIMALSPVTPQPKIGHWIDDKCSVCGKGTEDLIASPEWYRDEEPNFCPFCGVKLLKPQAESEE